MSLDEIPTTEKDATLEGQDSSKTQDSNSEKTLTESDAKKRVEDAVAQYGDRIKRETIDPITRERDTFKYQVEANADELKEPQEKIT